MIKNSRGNASKEDALKAAYTKTDEDFLQQVMLLEFEISSFEFLIFDILDLVSVSFSSFNIYAFETFQYKY